MESDQQMENLVGSSPFRTAINIENQCFANETPDFTPKNVKSGVFIFFRFQESVSPISINKTKKLKR